MPSKQFILKEVGTVNVVKRSNAKSIKLSVKDGAIRVSVPNYVPYLSGFSFAKLNISWIIAQLSKESIIADGDLIGISHKILFISSPNISRVRTKINHPDVIVTYPQSLDISSKDVQESAKKAAIKALKTESNEHLSKRLAFLSDLYGIEYKDIKIKALKSRWGSCNNHKEIVLSCYLMNLPEHLIDYVILHELTHTLVMEHGKVFWQTMEKYDAKTNLLRKEIKQYKPSYTKSK